MGSKRLGLARVQALLENLKREITWGEGTQFLGTLKANGGTAGEAVFAAPPFVPGLQDSIGVDVLDNHTVMHEAIFANVGSNTHIWETDTDNSSAVVAVVGSYM